MRDLRVLEQYRRIHETLGASDGASDYGWFVMANGIRVLASSGGGWDHVSCSFPGRTPNWNEMNEVRGLFFKPDETVVQIHPPTDLHINVMPHCLHLWRKQDAEHPLPPEWMIR